MDEGYLRIEKSITTEVKTAILSAVNKGANDSRNDPPLPK
jgi:hypothetical protein